MRSGTQIETTLEAGNRRLGGDKWLIEVKWSVKPWVKSPEATLKNTKAAWPLRLYDHTIDLIPVEEVNHWIVLWHLNTCTCGRIRWGVNNLTVRRWDSWWLSYRATTSTRYTRSSTLSLTYKYSNTEVMIMYETHIIKRKNDVSTLE